MILFGQMPTPPQQGWLDLLNSNGLATVLVFCGIIATATVFGSLCVVATVLWRFFRPRLAKSFEKHDALLDMLNQQVPKMADATAVVHGAVLETREVVKRIETQVNHRWPTSPLVLPEDAKEE